MNKIFTLIAFCFSCYYAQAQLSIPVSGSSAIITFESTVADVSNGAFDGSGFQSTPSTGQLDSDAFSTDGFGSDASFGSTCTSGDCARGADANGGVGTGGIYSFNVAGDSFIGVQPGSSDFTPGDITLAVTNNSGGVLIAFTLNFERWVNNDQGRSNSLNVSVSNDDVAYTQISAFDFTSAAASDVLGFVASPLSSTVTLGAPVADGGVFYIRWEGDDVSGGGSRDEFGIDDIQITNLILPIELTSFTATPQDRTTLLNWQTASEINNDFMAIETSTDGENFKEIGRVQGAGTTNETQQYQLVDENPSQGLNYYRLLQVDYDGTATYSKVVTVNFGQNTGDVSIYPNPTTNDLTIKFPANWEGETVITVLNGLGQVVKIITNPNQTFSVNDLPAGMYNLRITNGRQSISKPFVKN